MNLSQVRNPAVVVATFGMLVLAGCVGSNPPTKVADGLDAIEDSPGAVGGPIPEQVASASIVNAWGGQAEILLMDDDVSLGRTYSAGASPEPYACDCWKGSFRLPAGRLVLPGTDVIKIVVTAPSGASIGETVELRYRTAARDGYRETASTGTYSMSINVGPKDADAPLQPSSGWTFELAGSAGTEDATALSVLVKVQVSAHRGAPVPDIGPAPDPWKGGNESVLIGGRSLKFQALGQPTWVCPECEGNVWELDEGAIVPMGTKRIRATLSWDWVGPSAAFLEYENAAGDVRSDVEYRPRPTAQTSTSRTYEFGVTMNETESPFQERSFWAFQAYLETRDGWVSENPAAKTFFDAGVAAGTVKLQAVALAY